MSQNFAAAGNLILKLLRRLDEPAGQINADTWRELRKGVGVGIADRRGEEIQRARAAAHFHGFPIHSRSTFSAGLPSGE